MSKTNSRTGGARHEGSPQQGCKEEHLFASIPSRELSDWIEQNLSNLIELNAEFSSPDSRRKSLAR